MILFTVTLRANESCSQFDSLPRTHVICWSRKLVEKFGFDTEREMHTLELLKRRFGDGLLRPCEVMLKDLEDSRRINQAVAKDRALSSLGREESVAKVLEGVILSRHFWPKASTSHPLDVEALQQSTGGGEDGVSSLRLHPNMESALDAFSLEYKRMKQPRSLLWQKCLGRVQLELAIGEEGETREFTVSPLHASLIMFFSEREQWTLTALGEAVGMPPQMRAQLKRHMHRWVTLVRRSCPRVRALSLARRIARSAARAALRRLLCSAVRSHPRRLPHLPRACIPRTRARSAAATTTRASWCYPRRQRVSKNTRLRALS